VQDICKFFYAVAAIAPVVSGFSRTVIAAFSNRIASSVAAGQVHVALRHRENRMP